MTGPQRMRWIATWLARVVAGGVFLYAALPKLVDPVAFAEDIGNYQFFPYQLDNLIAGIVPLLEIIGAVAVLTGFKRRAGAVLLSALTVGFLVLILSVIVRDIDLACGCFGRGDEAAKVGWSLFWRDVGLLVATVAAALPKPGDTTDNPKPAAD